MGSMRLHELIFTCHKGVPFLSLSYQPKNDRFCQALGLGELSVDIFRPKSIARALGYLRANEVPIRARLLDARERYQQEIWAIMTDLTERTGARGM